MVRDSDNGIDIHEALWVAGYSSMNLSMYEKYLAYFRTVYKENHMGWTVTEQVRKSLAMGLAQAGLDQLLRGGLRPRTKI